MAEDKENSSSHVKRFARKTSENENSDSTSGGGGFASKYASGSAKDRVLESKSKIAELANQKPEAKKDFSGSGSIRNRSRTVNERSHADSLKASRADLIYLVRGKDRGRSAWHYVLIDKDKKEMFLAKSKTGAMDVADYGDILYSGWGENPPEDIENQIKNGGWIEVWEKKYGNKENN